MKQSFTVSSPVASLKVRLFNGVHVLVDGQPVTLAYDKVRALLAFLLIEAHDYPQSRETWPACSDRSSQKKKPATASARPCSSYARPLTPITA